MTLFKDKDVDPPDKDTARAPDAEKAQSDTDTVPEETTIAAFVQLFSLSVTPEPVKVKECVTVMHSLYVPD